MTPNPHDVAALSNQDLDLVTTLGVKSVNLSFSMKRTIKVDDEYRSFEAMESWTFRHDVYDVIPPEAAKLVTLVHGPRLIKNVVMGLHVGGVLPMAEAKEIVERTTKLYTQLIGVPRDPAGDQSDLRDPGHPGDPVGAHAGTGTGVPEGSAPGVP